MGKNSVELNKEKLEHIKQYYEQLFSAANRQRQEAFTLKGWCITLLIAYTGFSIQTSKIPLNLIFPAIILLSFYFLEAIVQSNFRRCRKQVKEIDKMFDIKCEQQFHNAVSKYLLPPLRTKERFCARVINLILALLTYYVWGWYLIFFILYWIILYVLTWYNVLNADLPT